MFGEVESQAVEALDLPGCFRMRSHSYLRAIQAGCSQDDDCLSLFSMSAPAGQPITSSILKPSTCESQGVVVAGLCEGPPHLPPCFPGPLPRAAAALAPAPAPGSPQHGVQASLSGHEYPAHSSALVRGLLCAPSIHLPFPPSLHICPHLCPWLGAAAAWPAWVWDGFPSLLGDKLAKLPL